MSSSNRHVTLHCFVLLFLGCCHTMAAFQVRNIYIFWKINLDQTVTIIIIIGIQPLGRFGQRPELSQAPGMALIRCILGKFLGAVCHCFPPRLDVPTFATRCLHVRHDARDPSGGRWNCGRECCPVILPKWRLPHHLGIYDKNLDCEGLKKLLL